MICPSCGGRKQVARFIDCTDKRQSGMSVSNCFTCRGTGEITDDHAARIEFGKVLRSDRIANGIGIRQEAARLGMTPQALSAIENGREPR